MNFVKHKTKNNDKSSVWYHFCVEAKGNPYAKCKACKKVLKTNGGSTKGLLIHLNSVHMLKLQKVINNEPRRKVRKITEFGYPSQEDSLSAVLARMTALDGFPFSKFITSTEVRKSLQSRGFEVPKSQETIKSHFMSFYKKCKENMKLEIDDLKKQGEKLSIAFDECTSISNKRFINISKSPTKNDILQKYVKEDKKCELKLLLDCQTRWNTLYDMIHRFSELEIPIKKALIDLKLVPLCDDEFLLLKQITKLLKPMKLTLEALCRNDMTLCTADAALEVMLNEISTTKGDLSRELYKCFRKRIEERRTLFSTILNFLTNPNKKSDLDSSLDIIQIKAEIKLLIARLNKVSDSNDFISIDIDDSTTDDDEGDIQSISIEQKLKNAIESWKSPKKVISQTDGDLETLLSREIELYMTGGVRGKYLQATYKYLQTVLPTSVECERCFSTASYITNKIRSSLADTTLDALIFLRSYLRP